jgi:peptidoglycan/xylan/chitin deacetylase (PgdA/CDA1 family)
MNRYFVRTPLVVQWLFKNVKWRVRDSKAVYLTFDDGPNPEVTPQLLDVLREFNVRATFFLIGENAEKFPELVQRIVNENHSIGFHCNQHINSRQLDRISLLKNFALPKSFPKTTLFRPPYGKLKIGQYHFLKNKFPLIGWTIMPGDFDQNISFQKKLNRLLRAKPGEIVVLHEIAITPELMRAYFQQTEIKAFEKL